MRIEGYVIVSANGMLADADRVMPSSLKFEADQKFFENALDHADVVVHGRNSFEDQERSPQRTRIVLTRSVSALASDPKNPKATLWNPARATFEDACRQAGITSGTAAIIGGPEVFEMFMDRYDTFWLSQAHSVTIPDGIGAFLGIPEHAPEAILESHGLKPTETRLLDAVSKVDVTAWRRE